MASSARRQVERLPESASRNRTRAPNRRPRQAGSGLRWLAIAPPIAPPPGASFPRPRGPNGCAPTRSEDGPEIGPSAPRVGTHSTDHRDRGRAGAGRGAPGGVVLDAMPRHRQGCEWPGREESSRHLQTDIRDRVGCRADGRGGVVGVAAGLAPIRRTSWRLGSASHRSRVRSRPFGIDRNVDLLVEPCRQGRHYRCVPRDLVARLTLGQAAQAWAGAGIWAMRIGIRSGEVSGSSSTILPFASR